MHTLHLPRPAGFELRAASEFYASFVPGSGMAAATADRLTFAFRLDRTFDSVAVALTERDEAIVAAYAGPRDGAAVARQVSRMLGLDADGEAWRAVGRRDPVVGQLQSEFPGFFTAAKASPYDAATWAILAQRASMAAAARWKLALTEAHGESVTLEGREYRVFPSPVVLEKVESFPGLIPEKLHRLRGVARAAIEGRLDADRLRALPEDEALRELMTIRGVGPWAASHILYRGAANQDAAPTNEPRVLHGVASAYGIPVPTPVAFARLAEDWRPFRMWVSVLFARHLARAGGWQVPGLGRERARAGRRLERGLRIEGASMTRRLPAG
jgi:DNA-3-methyladenine glycosylase II